MKYVEKSEDFPIGVYYGLKHHSIIQSLMWHFIIKKSIDGGYCPIVSIALNYLILGFFKNSNNTKDR